MSDADDAAEVVVVPEIFHPAPSDPLKLLDVRSGDENLRPSRYGENVGLRRKAVMDKCIKMLFETMIAAMDDQRVSLGIAPRNWREKLTAGKRFGLMKGFIMFPVRMKLL